MELSATYRLILQFKYCLFFCSIHTLNIRIYDIFIFWNFYFADYHWGEIDTWQDFIREMRYVFERSIRDARQFATPFLSSL